MIEEFEIHPGIVKPETIGLTTQDTEITLPKNTPGRLVIKYMIKGQGVDNAVFANVRLPFAVDDTGFAAYGEGYSFTGSERAPKYPTYTAQLAPSLKQADKIHFLQALIKAGLWVINVSDNYTQVVEAQQNGTLLNLEILFELQLADGVPKQ